MKLKYSPFPLLFLLLISCEKKLDENTVRPALQNIVFNYQKAIPIPKNSSNNKFIYVVDFKLEGMDSILAISRRSKGLFISEKYYGVYKIGDIPFVVSDKNNISTHFVNKKIRNNKMAAYEIKQRELDYNEHPPVYNYKIHETEANLIRIDTISLNWKK